MPMIIQAEIGGVPIGVEVSSGSVGTEPTSRNRPGEVIHGMFEEAQTVIEELALSAAEVAERVARRAGRPEQMEVQFGIKFSAQGKIIIASASAEASLTVKVIYGDRQVEDGAGQSDQENGPSQEGGRGDGDV